MTDDIVDRLRDHLARVHPGWSFAPTVVEASDEIESLRRENESITKMYRQMRACYEDALAALKKERNGNARLRGALEYIAVADRRWDTDGPPPLSERIPGPSAVIAEQALKGETE